MEGPGEVSSLISIWDALGEAPITPGAAGPPEVLLPLRTCKKVARTEEGMRQREGRKEEERRKHH